MKNCELVVRENDEEYVETCGICYQVEVEVCTPMDIFTEDGKAVCTDCARRLAPELLEVVENYYEED